MIPMSAALVFFFFPKDVKLQYALVEDHSSCDKLTMAFIEIVLLMRRPDP